MTEIKSSKLKKAHFVKSGKLGIVGGENHDMDCVRCMCHFPLPKHAHKR